MATAFVGIGGGGRLVVEALHLLGVDRTIGIDRTGCEPSPSYPEGKMLYLTCEDPGFDLQAGERIADRSQKEIFEAMSTIDADRFVICVCARDGLGGGSTLVALEAAEVILKKRGVSDGIRVGIAVALPPVDQLRDKKISDNCKFLVSKLCDLVTSKTIDPLLVGDAFNIYSLLTDFLPVEDDVEEHEEQKEKTPNPRRMFGSNMYGE